MYIAGFVIPVPEAKMEVYRQWAENGAAIEATLDAAEVGMHEDGRLDVAGEIPFDPRRLILGCFSPIYTTGRG